MSELKLLAELPNYPVTRLTIQHWPALSEVHDCKFCFWKMIDYFWIHREKKGSVVLVLPGRVKDLDGWDTPFIPVFDGERVFAVDSWHLATIEEDL